METLTNQNSPINVVCNEKERAEQLSNLSIVNGTQSPEYPPRRHMWCCCQCDTIYDGTDNEELYRHQLGHLYKHVIMYTGDKFCKYCKERYSGETLTHSLKKSHMDAIFKYI